MGLPTNELKKDLDLASPRMCMDLEMLAAGQDGAPGMWYSFESWKRWPKQRMTLDAIVLNIF